MQAVIMAGGKGTRLATVIKNIPKPMVPIEGKPLLEYQIENLKENGVTNIILIVGHLGDVIRDHFGDGSAFGVNISYYVEESPLGTAGALAKIRDRLDDTFFLVFGDLFININYDRFIAFHRDTGALITLFAHPNSHPYDSDIIITDDESRVTGWSYKKDFRTDDYQNLVNAGLYVMQRSVADKIEKIQQTKHEDKVDLEKELIIPLICESPFYAYHSTEYVKDIGTPERLQKVTADYVNGVCEQRNLKHKQKCIFLDRDGTINKYAGFLRTVDQVELEPKAAEAIRLINESEYLSVVITNQPVIARGECSFEELSHIHNRLYTLLGREGAYLDGLYFCPHHPDKGFEGEVSELKFDCDCRKPKTGMLKKAEADFNADLTNSWFIGDTTMDVQTGKNAGMHTIMLQSGDPKKTKFDVTPDAIADDLLEAVKMILSGEGT
jgi:histidinol-phosphate phosphatase family protein